MSDVSARQKIERLRDIASVKHAERLDVCCALSLFSRQREPHREWEREAGICICGAKQQNEAVQLLAEIAIGIADDSPRADWVRRYSTGWILRENPVTVVQVHTEPPEDVHQYIEVYVIPVHCFDREESR